MKSCIHIPNETFKLLTRLICIVNHFLYASTLDDAIFSVQAGHEPQSNILTTAPDLAGQARVSNTQLLY
jgi:hypothetical protein